MDPQKLEDELAAKAVAPRVTKSTIDAMIEGAEASYHVFPGTTVTACCLKLENGYCLVGTSACASPENFNEEIGRRLAHERAAKQLWEFEGYRLRCELAGGDRARAN